MWGLRFSGRVNFVPAGTFEAFVCVGSMEHEKLGGSCGRFVSVMLVLADVDKVFKVASGKILTLPEMPNTQFQVRAIKEANAVIRDVKTSQDYNIPRLQPNEWNDVPQPVQPATPKSP